jgi:hypothetical protein
MKRAWIGLAMLSASWLFGLSYYEDARPLVWAVLIVAGTCLLTEVRLAMPEKVESAAAGVLLLVAAPLVPWPYRAAVLLLLVGILLSISPIPRQWPKTLAAGAITAGIVLTAQSLAVLAYQYVTGRSHELPRALGSILSAVARLLGMEVALCDSNLALYSVRRVHQLGATWELLVDLPTLCFLIGGIVLICTKTRLGQHSRVAAIAKAPAMFILAVILWLPARAAALMAILLHRALRTEYDAPLVLMNQFWNPWVLTVLLAVPVLLAFRLVRPRTNAPSVLDGYSGPAKWGRIIPPALIFAAVLLLCFGSLWDPCGKRKEGRCLVDEHLSTWERTDRPLNEDWYGQDSGYNYACIYDYCSRFYQMGRLNNRVDDQALQDCDVLVVKVPTSRYDVQEIDAIERFVRRGGGLLLVAEHTNVFNSGTYINDIARRFGFRFRYDCLFDIDSVFEQLWRPGRVPHPIVQYMPDMDFAVSCSINPGISRGRSVIRSTGLRNLGVDYHVSNYYPQVEDHAYSRYGAFTQLWTTRAGAGRVVAFTDSTIFSNFATFEPGKAELMLGMLEWLNHRNPAFNWGPWLVLAGVLAGISGLAAIRKRRGACVLVAAIGIFALAVITLAVPAIHRRNMPAPRAARPYVHVVMDRTLCDTPVSKSGFIAGDVRGFGIFERWILRLGYFTSRRSGPDVTTGELIVFAYPTRTVTSDFRDAIVKYVESGGKVLVLDSPENAGSTANSLLYPFGLSLDASRVLNGSVEMTDNRPAIQIESAQQVTGGQPVVSLNGSPIGATIRHGQGSITALGFGSLFVDSHMGVTGDVVPDAQLRNVYDLEFRLLRQIISPPGALVSIGSNFEVNRAAFSFAPLLYGRMSMRRTVLSDAANSAVLPIHRKRNDLENWPVSVR